MINKEVPDRKKPLFVSYIFNHGVINFFKTFSLLGGWVWSTGLAMIHGQSWLRWLTVSLLVPWLKPHTLRLVTQSHKIWAAGMFILVSLWFVWKHRLYWILYLYNVWLSPKDSILILSPVWFTWQIYVSFLHTGLGLPLLSGDSIAAGIAAGLSSCISSQAVYVLTARLLKAPTPPAKACNRGVSAEGLGSVLAGLMGAPLGLCSSVPNACTTSLSQVRSNTLNCFISGT